MRNWTNKGLVKGRGLSVCPPAGSQRISDSEFSDYDCEDGIGVISGELHASSCTVTPELSVKKLSQTRRRQREIHSHVTQKHVM